MMTVLLQFYLREKYPKTVRNNTTDLMLLYVTKGEFFFTVLFFCLSHLTRAKELLIKHTHEKHTCLSTTK